MEPYSTEKARLITKEMTELLVLDLVKKGLVTKKVALTIGYDRTSIEYLYHGPTIQESTFQIAGTKRKYKGAVGMDHYGRPCPKYAHGTGNLPQYTSSTRKIMECMLRLIGR
jgi:DNA polymerase V